MTAVVITPPARDHARRAATWWRENRPAAPRMFSDEFGAALRLLARAPQLGRPYAHPTRPGVRRLLFGRTGFHVYYVVDTSADVLVVLAVWAAQRGAPAPL